MSNQRRYEIPPLPRYIALCGNPGAGKSEVQKILSRCFGVGPIDDGRPLREFGKQFLGLTQEQVSTQDGKRETVEIAGQPWEVRKILGELGNALELKLGAHVMPHMAMIAADKSSYASNSFGSVRRDQGLAYKAREGVVIGIGNPDARPSENEFDSFDATIVDAWIWNDALSRGFPREAALRDLEHKVWDALMTLSLRVALPEAA